MNYLQRTLSAGLALCCAASTAAAQDPTPTPACSLADITGALETDLTCSTDGVVFFGTDVTTFITNQCGAISIPGEGQGGLKQSQAVCIRCAMKSADAFKA